PEEPPEPADPGAAAAAAGNTAVSRAAAPAVTVTMRWRVRMWLPCCRNGNRVPIARDRGIMPHPSPPDAETVGEEGKADRSATGVRRRQGISAVAVQAWRTGSVPGPSSMAE